MKHVLYINTKKRSSLYKIVGRKVIQSEYNKSAANMHDSIIAHIIGM